MAKTTDKKQKLQRSEPEKEKTGQKKFKNVAKNVVGPVTKDKKQKTRGRKSKNQEIEQKKNAFSKVSGFLAEYIPEYLHKYLTKSGRGNEKQAKMRQKVCVAAFFLALLVLVFVGSSVGFSKCEPGFRSVRKLRVINLVFSSSERSTEAPV